MKTKFPVIYFVPLAILLADITFVSASVYTERYVPALIGCGIAGALILIMMIVSLVYSKNSLRHFSKMNTHLETSAAQYMHTLPAPVAIIDDSRDIVWYNQVFAEKISLGSDAYGRSFGDYVQLDLDSLLTDGFAYCHVNGSVYKVVSEEFKEKDLSFSIIHFSDETSYFNLRKRFDEEHPNVVILSIDNYDEIMQNAKESEKALASVETEQLIEKFMSSTNGFIKKISSNTFYAVIENRHLEEKITNKFKILDMARNIKIAGKYPLTFSIGVGQGASSLAESEKIARQCLDMALGRGGDQAVVKTDSGFRFFGGVSKGVEKMSRAKTRIIANAMEDVIRNSNKVYIMGHRFGDLDSVGASCGLAGAIRLLGKEVHIVVDRNKNLASHLIDLVESQSERDLFVTPSAAVSSVENNDLLIVVDTHNRDFIESRELYDRIKRVIIIDHHRKTVNYIDNAVIFHHEPYASSASEMVTELIQYFSFDTDDNLPSICAEALLSGIMLDTKNFVMRTGVRTFEAAAYLKKQGADTVSVKLLFSNSFDAYKRKTQVVANAKLHKKCAIAVADFKSDDIRVVAPQAADELLSISDVDASFVVYSTGSVTNISARSLGALNVQVVMEELGGGGHQTMAAAQLENTSLQEAVKLLINAIDSRQEETYTE
ncbi:c-di-AMP phosphodiesterase, consists of a GGDEF-like and DHH domains [Ruminococcus sp. YRD2003]|uniref:DHH family phosphoesterase n=1 Tax=Ruminococcus sp. YRD2003 TaxID=1452313 RepID=UPI0008C0F283|nr:c-di-AMP phosphodiesterase, consists of a GGDEF-like and DHH domains [Ruminococcus flavefaciens]